MNPARYPVLIAVLVIALTFCGCPTVAPPAKAELQDLTLCQGWDDGNPIVLPDLIPPDETRICICGHLEADRAVYLQVSWGREGRSLLRDLQQFNSGPLLSCIEESDGFAPGHYKVAVIMEKWPLGLVEFTVGEE